MKIVTLTNTRKIKTNIELIIAILLLIVQVVILNVELNTDLNVAYVSKDKGTIKAASKSGIIYTLSKDNGTLTSDKKIIRVNTFILKNKDIGNSNAIIWITLITSSSLIGLLVVLILLTNTNTEYDTNLLIILAAIGICSIFLAMILSLILFVMTDTIIESLL